MLVNIFCQFDDFFKLLSKIFQKNQIGKKNNLGRKPKLTIPEIMTIAYYYQESGYKNFKYYYNFHVKKYLKSEFPSLVSYNRFVELMEEVAVPFMLYFKFLSRGKCTGYSIIDSFQLKVCHVKRANSHKLFKGLAKKGKTSTGWFFGLKVHFIINHSGEIIDICLTSGNVSDNDKDIAKILTKDVFGKLIGDKGYIGLFKELYKQGIKLIHKLRSNMKNKLYELEDKILLNKRGVIESVINILKNVFNIEHTRHRSTTNFLVNLFTALIAYVHRPNKPSFSNVFIES